MLDAGLVVGLGLLGLIVFLGSLGLGVLVGWAGCRGLARAEPTDSGLRVTLDPGRFPWSGAEVAFALDPLHGPDAVLDRSVP